MADAAPRAEASLGHEPLSIDAVAARVADPEHGASVCFTGTTRAEAGLHAVVALWYEAYEEMALPEMRAIAEEAAARYGAHVAVAHRLGRVEVGEPSVVVAASAGHRPEAFAACRHAIDALKRRVPIWKRTIHEDGTTVWQDGVADAAPRVP